MGIFNVLLAVAKGAKDTGEVIEISTVAADRLDALIRAEEACDRLLPANSAMYSHAVRVTPVGAPALAMAA